MSPSALQSRLQNLIEEALDNLGLPDSPITLYEPYKYTLKIGGKRIRPYLTLLACGMCGGQTKDALPAALAVEILHNFTLVHDDIMDGADTRRGSPSVFKKWDENTAILSGDVMFADAFRQLAFYGSDQSYSKQEYSDMLDAFTTATITVCEGQALDMEFVGRAKVSHKDYIQMIKGKTAALLTGALRMGAIAAHADQEKQLQLGKLGEEMGIAFQIQDDLLDVTADPEKFGKKPGGDIYEGKKTYLTILALERANKEQASFIQHVLESRQPTEDDVDQVLVLLKELNVISDISNEIDRHYEKALDLLEEFNDNEYQHELKNLLIFLQNRDH